MQVSYKTTLLKVVTTMAVGLGSISVLLSQEAEQQPGPRSYLSGLLKAPPRQIAETDDDLLRLLTERYNVALTELKERYTGYQTGTFPAERVLDAGRRLLEAELALANDPQAKVKVLEKQLQMVREYESIIQTQVNVGVESTANLYRVRYERLSVEIELLREKQAR